MSESPESTSKRQSPYHDSLYMMLSFIQEKPLPSVRQLASDLAVAPNTIVRAYKELERDNWVVTSARRGVMVAERPPTMSQQERRSRLEEAVAGLLVIVRQLEIGPRELYAELERQLSAASTDD
jgi:DNA-binding transcriptional regulator YhcF (GntR family)